MQLLVIRHGIAVDPDAAADDALRELTPEGRKKMERAAQGLRRKLDPPDILATSPLLRAQQTAEILAEAFGGVAITTVDELTPSQPPTALGPWLGKHKAHDLVAMVGHEPHLSAVVSWLLTGNDCSLLHFGKGAACLLDFSEAVGPGRASLLWFMRSGHLRALAG